MSKLRIGVIGAGGIADRRTIPGLLQCRHAELGAVMGPNLERTEAIRQKYGAPRAYDDERALLGDPDVDAVYIASPVGDHARQTMLAADYGKPILLEKPIALSCEEGERVLNYCARKNVQVGAGFMMRFSSHVQSMKRAVEAGKLGQIVSGYSQFTLWLPGGNWRLDRARAGGGCLMDMGVHVIDLFCFVTGMRVTRVAAMNETITFGYDVEDASTVLLRLENGAQCVVQTNFNIPDAASKWRFELFGTKGRLMGDTMIGQVDGGTLNLLALEREQDYDPEQNHADDQGLMVPGEFGNLYTRQLDAFAEAILAGRPVPVSAADALAMHRAMRVIAAAFSAVNAPPVFRRPHIL